MRTSVPLEVSTRLISDGELLPRQLEDQVVALPTLGEVLVRVVDDVRGTDR